MKGLLLKEWYCIKSYFKAFFVSVGAMLLMGNTMEGGAFLLYFPCLLAGMIANSLMSYDESDKWGVYALTLPYTRTQLVSAKYLITLLMGGAVIGLSLLLRGVSMAVQGTLNGGVLLGLVQTMLPMTLLPAAVLLPFVYKFGVEKGRIAYYCVIGGFSALVAGISGVGKDMPIFSIPEGVGMILLGVSVGAFALSWWLSIRFYQKKEV